MIDHFGINCADWDKSKAFYDKVLGVLGYTRQMDFQVAIGYGKDGKPDFWIADMNAGDAAGPNREVHFAFQAADTDAVQAFYDAALEAGRRVAARAAAVAGVSPRLLRRLRPRPRRQQHRGGLPRRAAAGLNRPGSVRGMADSDAAAVRELLRDSFTRLIEHVEELTDGLTDEVAFFRPTADANSIAWLIWHSARQQDLQLSDIAGIEQVWSATAGSTGSASTSRATPSDTATTPDEVGKVRASADLLAGYYHAVHKATLEYIASVTPDELGRVVDTRWNPPVTASARLVSIIDDSAQHLGQAAYVRGIA